MYSGPEQVRPCMYSGPRPCMYSGPEQVRPCMYSGPRPCMYSGPTPCMYSGPEQWRMPLHTVLPVEGTSREDNTRATSVQAGAVLMPLAMFLLSLKSIRVLSIMNFILKLAYLYKVTEKKRLIYMHLL